MFKAPLGGGKARRGGVSAWPWLAPRLGRRSRPLAGEAAPPSPPGPRRVSAGARHAGKVPGRRPFCLIGCSLEEAFRLESGPRGLVRRPSGWCFSLVGARAGVSSRPGGSTMISAAQLLDELMGRDRNLAPDEKRSNVRWDHESVSPVGLGPVPKRLGEGNRREGKARAEDGPGGSRCDLGSWSRRLKHLTAEGGGRVALEGGFRANPGDRVICCSLEEVRDCTWRGRRSTLVRSGNAGKRKEGLVVLHRFAGFLPYENERQSLSLFGCSRPI